MYSTLLSLHNTGVSKHIRQGHAPCINSVRYSKGLQSMAAEKATDVSYTYHVKVIGVI